MSKLFYENETFNEPINKWVTNNVTNMSGMFQGASKFNQPIDDYIRVPGQRLAFAFTQYRVGVNDSKEVTGRRLIYKLPVFLVRIIASYAFGDHIIGGFDTSQVTNMSGIFCDAPSFDQPIGQWKTDQVTNMGWYVLCSFLF
jgi:hypothetical protein